MDTVCSNGSLRLLIPFLIDKAIPILLIEVVVTGAIKSIES